MSVKTKTWEVGASLYPWDLHDEGVNAVLDNLQEKALVNSVYLVGLMHPEPRPWGDNDFPSQPREKEIHGRGQPGVLASATASLWQNHPRGL